MGDLVVTVSPLQVLPLILFAIITMFCVIGNVVKGFEIDVAGVFSLELNLWALEFCESGSTACMRVNINKFDEALEANGMCDGAIKHIQAAGAFGIITSIVAGVSTILSLVFLLRNNITKPKIIGICLAVTNFVLNLVAFILYITIEKAECLEKIDLDIRAGAFMYLAAFVISIITMCMYAIQDGGVKSQQGQVSSQQRAPHNDFNNNSNNYNDQYRQAPRVKPGQGNERSVTPQQQQQTPPQQQQYQQQQQRNTGSPNQKKVAPPPTHNAPVTPAPAAAPEDLWPDGDDWVVDPSSDLLWSETKHLFFDRQSGQFFDPKSDQWYDPERNNWYKIQ